MHLGFKSSIQSGYVELRFNGKPPADIRAILKANGFRWSPANGVWWRTKVAGSADFIGALERRLNPGRPDGQCWVCRTAPGFFRQEGPATPVRCNECQAAIEQQRAAERRCDDDPMGVDALWEDYGARQCGV